MRAEEEISRAPSVVDRDERAERFVEEGLLGPIESSVFPASREAEGLASGLRLASGTRIGDFTLVKLLGRGGMGEVWEAEQASLRRSVALKLMLPERSSGIGLEYFSREARAAGRLTHPGIVSVHGRGEDDGLHWIAMELVDGCRDLRAALDDLRQRPRLESSHFERAAALVAKIADALEAAHGADVIHRDIKPGNVLVTPAGEPMVTDFGLAKVMDEHSISVQGDMVGTYVYMSPELAADGPVGVDHRSDVFSLGVVLYELLTLARPFQGDTPQQITRRVALEDPAPPMELRPDVPRDLSVVCMKALEKDPAKRYPSMAELARDLRRYLRCEPILARPAGLVERAFKWRRRNPAAAAVLLVALVGAAATSAAAAIAQARSGALASANARLEVEAARQSDLVEYFGLALRNSPRNLGELSKAKLMNSPAIAGLEPDQRLLFEAALSSIPSIELGVAIAGEAILEPIERAIDKSSQADPAVRARAMSKVAKAWHHPLAQYDRALARQRMAVEILEGLPADHAQALGDAKIFLAQYLRDTDDLESADDILEELIAEGTARDGESSRIAARALALRASMQLARGRFAEAERSYAEVVDRYDRIWGRDFHDTIVERREWGAALISAGRPAEAAAILTELLEGGYDDVDGSLEGYIRSALGDALLALGRHADAIEAFERAVLLIGYELDLEHAFLKHARRGLEEARRRAAEAGE
ncbi:MAG: serine/threonine-protein kinase [Planctomycetota bacterium]|nr:serine/threonine-protein kinase [Planctomycetota bacterium]